MMAQASLTVSDRPDAETAAILDLVREEMALLDGRKFEEWMDLFTDDGFYWAPVDPDQADPKRHVSLFFDDKSTMRTRINRLHHPRIHCQTPPSRTVHIAGNLHVVGAIDLTVTATCNFIMLEYRPTRGQNIWGGRYEYRLVPAAGARPYKIAMKKASLVNSDDQFPSLAVWF